MEMLESLQLYNFNKIVQVAIFLTILIQFNEAKLHIKITLPTDQQHRDYKDTVRPSMDFIYHTTCNYNGVTYAHGTFKPSDCVTCLCNGTSGDVTCSAQSCPQIRNCIKFSTREGECCPQCIEYGCFYNGTAYSPGQKISKGPCTKCFCPWETSGERGGVPKCLTIRCNTPRCVDSKVPPGKCCPTCPNGPNCFLDDQIISEGQRIYVNECRFCFCSDSGYVARDQPRHATCQRSFFCL